MADDVRYCPLLSMAATVNAVTCSHDVGDVNARVRLLGRCRRERCAWWSCGECSVRELLRGLGARAALGAEGESNAD